MTQGERRWLERRKAELEQASISVIKIKSSYLSKLLVLTENVLFEAFFKLMAVLLRLE